MSLHVHGHPFLDREQTLAVLGAQVTIAPLRPFVWISITAPEVLAPPPPDAPRFPALVDTGFNGALFLQEHHLRRLVNVSALPEQSPGNVRLVDRRSESYRRYRARVWMHSYGLTQPAPALDLDISRGVLVWSEPVEEEPQGVKEGFLTWLLRRLWPWGRSEPAPRLSPLSTPQGPPLPTLGAWALRPRELTVTVDYDTLRLSIGVV